GQIEPTKLSDPRFSRREVQSESRRSPHFPRLMSRPSSTTARSCWSMISRDYQCVPYYGDVRAKSALVLPSEGTSKVSLESLLYLAGIFSFRGQPPRGGRASPSPTTSATRVMMTRCFPTQAPVSPLLPTRVYSPLSLVLPMEPPAPLRVPAGRIG